MKPLIQSVLRIGERCGHSTPDIFVNVSTVSIELMNSCHRIHHSGIHAVFLFVHLLLVLVICFDTLSFSCLSIIFDSFGISFPTSSLTHTRDTLKCLHGSKQIRMT